MLEEHKVNSEMLRRHLLYGSIHCFGKAINENFSLLLPVWKGKCGQLDSSQRPLNMKWTHYSEVLLLLVLRLDRNSSHCTWQSFTIHGVLDSKTTMRYHLTPVRMAIIQKKKNLQTINGGEGLEKSKPSCTVGRNVHWYSLQRIVWKLLKNYT